MKIQSKIKVIAAVALGAVAPLAAAAVVYYAQLGGTVNVGSPQASPSVAINAGTPFVAWNELDANNINQVKAKQWNGASWTALGGNINVDLNSSADFPFIAHNGVAPYVAFTQSGQGLVYVKVLSGNSWVQVGGALNADSGQTGLKPQIAFAGTTPYVAWVENLAGFQMRARVKKWNGFSWVAVGGDAFPSFETGMLGFAELSFGISKTTNTPFVAVAGFFNGQFSSPNVANVRKFNGVSWVDVGGGLNVDNSGFITTLSLALNGSNPCVATSEYPSNNGYLKCWNGVSWAQSGGSFNPAPNGAINQVRLAYKNTTPYVVYDAAGAITVKYWNGLQWVLDPATSDQASLNVDASRPASGAAIASDGTKIAVAFKQSTATGASIYAKRK
jgi:hypothetical protein